MRNSLNAVTSIRKNQNCLRREKRFFMLPLMTFVHLKRWLRFGHNHDFHIRLAAVEDSGCLHFFFLFSSFVHTLLHEASPFGCFCLLHSRHSLHRIIYPLSQQHIAIPIRSCFCLQTFFHQGIRQITVPLRDCLIGFCLLQTLRGRQHVHAFLVGQLRQPFGVHWPAARLF